MITVSLMFGPVTLGGVTFDIHTMLYGSAMIMIGTNMIFFSLFTRIYAIRTRFIPTKENVATRLAGITTEKGAIAGVILTLAGIVMTVLAFMVWKHTAFGDLNPQEMMRMTIPALTLMVVGIEMIFASFFIGILNIKHQ